MNALAQGFAALRQSNARPVYPLETVKSYVIQSAQTRDGIVPDPPAWDDTRDANGNELDYAALSRGW